MSDNPSFPPSPSVKHTNPFSSLFGSPKFMGFSAKSFSESEASMSPTSILETKTFSAIKNPFFTEKSNRKPYWGNGDSRAIGLGIVDALTKEKNEKKTFNPSSRMVLFGSQLKIQIPTEKSISVLQSGSVESPQTPIESGVNNMNSRPAFQYPAMLVGEVRSTSPRIFTGPLSPQEMELSEDYTCVISHGPNPKTTHIFENYIVESCGGNGFVNSKKENRFSTDRSLGHTSPDFLSFCHSCRKRLLQGQDIYMYRGEQAFCSLECRELEMSYYQEVGEDCFEDPEDDF